MRRTFCWTVLAVVFVAVGQLPASASGSVGAGGSKPGGRSDYTLGKSIVHRELVCKGCAINRRDFNAGRAQAMNEDIEAALSGGSPTDAVRSLCATGDRAECAGRLRAVQTYMKRRFRL